MSSFAATVISDRKCPICLEEAEFGILTNCGHLFCARCIANYVTFDLSQGKWPLQCPYCRQQVSELRMRVSRDELNDVRLLEQMDVFCCKFKRYHVKRTTEDSADGSGDEKEEERRRRKWLFRSGSFISYLHNGRLQSIFGSFKWNL